ncbi:MAG: O-antigen ligase family protein [Planctomycetota bacterium]|nr:O-antigen ligase family protein [Planctomycetota bacterium]
MFRSTLFKSTAILTGGCLIASPWCWGGVSYFAQMWIACCACAALSICVGWTSTPVLERRIPLMFVPLALALVMGGLQLAPLMPDGIFARHLAAAQYWHLFAGQNMHQVTPAHAQALDVQQTVKESPGQESVSLSLYPWETRKRLASLACGVSFFVLGSVLFRHPTSQKLLLGIISLNGCGVALSGLAQKWALQTQVAEFSTLGDNRLFGPYINKNNGAGYVLIALATTLGLSVWYSVTQEHKQPGASGYGWWRWAEDRASSPANSRASLLRVILDVRFVGSLAIVAFLVAGITASLSRSAVIAMCIASVVALTLSVAGDRRRLFVLMSGGCVGTCLLLLLLGQVGRAATRLTSLLDWSNIAADSRFAHWLDGWRAGQAFGVFGSGLGTYRFAYPLWETKISEEWFHHAENQFLETFVETGLVGTGLLLLCIVFFARACWQLLQSCESWERSLGITGGFLLISQVVHGMSDFSLYLPANTITMAVICGLVAGTAQRVGAQANQVPVSWPTVVWHQRLTHYRGPGLRLALAFLAATLLIGVGDLRQADALSRTYGAAKQGDWGALSSHAETCREIRVLTHALNRQSGDARAHLKLGELWIHAYRQWVAAQQAVESPSAAVSPLTAPMYLHARAHRFKATGARELAVIQTDSVTQRYLDAAVFHFRQARQSCPLLTLPHLRLAQLLLVTGDLSDESIHLARVQMLCGPRSDLLRACGTLAWNAGNKESACRYWRRALTASPTELRPILGYVDQSGELPIFLERILPEDLALWLEVSRDYLQAERFTVLRRQLLDRVKARLAVSDLPFADTHHVQAQVYQLQGNHREAQQSYLSALQLQPRQYEWRFEFSQLLQEMGNLQMAYEQALQCCREEPHNVRYQEYVKMLAFLLSPRTEQKKVTRSAR